MDERDDSRFMRRALRLAERGRGTTAPNPTVGAVVVGPDGQVLAEGFHRVFGGPHAEVEALGRIPYRTDLSGATLYCTLEPCSHWGKTPPCADLIVRRGVGRVVVGTGDPNPLVAGRGVGRLRDAGVAVTVGVEEAACRELNAGFFSRITTGRPLVVLKWAQSLDGATATATGSSRWITSEPARRRVHRLRAASDAVLVGTGTAAADDPELTVRHGVRVRQQPLRLVLDRTLRLGPTLKLFTDDHRSRTVVLTAPLMADRQPRAEQLRAAGVRVVEVVSSDGQIDLEAMLHTVGELGVNTLLVEGGSRLATALIRSRLVDQLAVFIAPKLVGAGVAALADLGIRQMDDALTLARWTVERVGPDLLVSAHLPTVNSPEA